MEAKQKAGGYEGIFDSLEVPTRIIFLDIDGVMVTDFRPESIAEDGWHMFSPIAVNCLNAVVEQADASLVISSSWRKRDLKWIRGIFETRGFKYPQRIIGETMRGYHFVEKGVHLPIPRGLEIKAWLDKYIRKVEGKGFVNDCYDYVIVDDDSDMLLEQAKNFIKVPSASGFDYRIAAKVLWHFNN